jgi:hypothetical protein
MLLPLTQTSFSRELVINHSSRRVLRKILSAHFEYCQKNCRRALSTVEMTTPCEQFLIISLFPPHSSYLLLKRPRAFQSKQSRKFCPIFSYLVLIQTSRVHLTTKLHIGLATDPCISQNQPQNVLSPRVHRATS